MSDRLKYRAFYQGRFIYKSLTDSNYYDKDNKYIGLANTLPDTLDWEQCSGFKDKNGKLIYEGDIIREVSIDEDSAMGAEFEEVSVVCFGGGDYPYSFTLKNPRFYRGYALLNYGYMRQDIEVIGNIHENPERINADNA